MNTAPLRILIVPLLLAAASPGLAAIEEGYDAREAAIPTTWYGLADPAAMRADRDYIAGMRPHHAGALSMSEQYLADPQARSPVLRALAVAIIRNQRFEIGLMDEVARNLDQPALRLPLGISLQPMATEGMAQLQRFMRSPIPGLADALAGNPVSARDVQFAKGMTIHHQAALQMARAYLAHPAARNHFLGLMNVDVETDQSQEIALMQAVIRAYRGNPDLVMVDPSMIHGMEGMAHGGMATPAAHRPGHAPAADPHDGHVMPAAPQPATAALPRARATTPAARRPAPLVAADPPMHY